MAVRRFRLSESFLEPYKTREVPWGPIGYIIFKRTYSRLLSETEPGTQGTEEWWQTCRRVIEGMFDMQKQYVVNNGLPWNDGKAQRTAKEAYERLFVGKWTPPGRGLWMMNTKFVKEKTQTGLLNCGFRSTKDLATRGGYLIAWIMDALMLGVGVGVDTLGANTLIIKEPEFTNDIHVIDDSREGWVESLRILVDGFLFGHKVPRFNYSKIRGPGELIKGFGGTSAGPLPLIELHWQIALTLGSHIDEEISSTDIVDVITLVGRCVVSGNVRRSATSALSNYEDNEFINLKQNPLLLKHHRWCSNNSIIAKVGMDYSPFVNLTKLNGEPGYCWLENIRTHGRFKDPPRDDDLNIAGLNPCFEQQLEDGELCCLAELFPARHNSLEDVQKTVKICYLYAKTITLATTQWPESNQKMKTNRRIGLSLTGFVQACNKFGRRNMYEWCDKTYNYVQELDKIYSDWLCIPRSRRMTSLKPSGSVSKLFGATPGLHHPEAEYYIQRIRFSDTSDLLPALRRAGYFIEPCKYSPNTMVVDFPIKEPYFTKGKKDITMWEQLEIAAQLQYYWADNSISITVTFKPDEAKDIAAALELYETRLKAVSFLQYKETGYEQAPMEEITKEQYYKMISGITKLTTLETQEKGEGERFCTNDTCQINFAPPA